MSAEARIDEPETEAASLESGPESQSETTAVRRSHLEIFCDILRAVGSGADRPNVIMFKANLSWEILQSYLRTLQSQGLLESVASEGKKTYRLSSKGYDILKQFVSIRRDMDR
jgi:predicted transcriptional regulator